MLHQQPGAPRRGAELERGPERVASEEDTLALGANEYEPPGTDRQDNLKASEKESLPLNPFHSNDFLIVPMISAKDGVHGVASHALG